MMHLCPADEPRPAALRRRPHWPAIACLSASFAAVSVWAQPADSSASRLSREQPRLNGQAAPNRVLVRPPLQAATPAPRSEGATNPARPSESADEAARDASVAPSTLPVHGPIQAKPAPGDVPAVDGSEPESAVRPDQGSSGWIAIASAIAIVAACLSFRLHSGHWPGRAPNLSWTWSGLNAGPVAASGIQVAWHVRVRAIADLGSQHLEDVRRDG